MTDQLPEFRFCPQCAAPLERRSLKAGEPERLTCSSSTCASVLYLDPKLAACTITLCSGSIVLLRRGNEPALGKWGFPGGYVDRGESVRDAALRETFEEVGLRASLTGILEVYSNPGDEVVVVVYAAHADGAPTAGDEALEVRLFRPEDLPWDELAFESTRNALRDYVQRFFPRVRPPRTQG